MIASIGYKKSLVLFALAAVLGVLVFSTYVVFQPKADASKTELMSLQAQASTLQSEVDQMRLDFTQFDSKKAVFENISRMGFFNDQNRVLARERFDTLQKLSKIMSARYEIKPAKIFSQDIPLETGFVVMESPITMTLTALDDLDIYRFIYYLNYGFPGHVTISNLDIKREGVITPEILKEIGTGNPPALITAKMEMQWRTMARKESIAPETLSSNTAVQDTVGAQ
jgi:outer membrane murein-binding lipoprotein Lpp